MRVALCYIVVTDPPGRALTMDWASRFAATYAEYPPGYEHDLLLIANGGPLPTPVSLLFEPFQNVTVFPRENDPGWDITGYIAAARAPAADYDLLVCLGESCYAHQAGWLARMVDAVSRHGSGMYGFFSSNVVRPHLNTTGFACHPALLREFPWPINTRMDRYVFEHGKNSFWKWVRSRGKPTKFVTWDGEWDPHKWRSPRNILWRGDQSNLLLWANHSDGFLNGNTVLQALWSANVDRPYHEL